MSKFHINGETGTVGRCRARRNQCPYGDEAAHYATAEQARAAYEETMDALTLNPSTSRISLSALNLLARESSSDEELGVVLLQGSERSLQNLAKNPNVPGSVLVLARQRASRVETSEALLRHPNYPVEAMSGHDFKLVYDSSPHSPWGLQGQLLASDGLTDEHIEAIGNLPDHHALSNSKNKLSQTKIVELAEKNWNSLRSAIKSGRYPFEERASFLQLDQLRSITADLTDPLHLELAAKRASEETDNAWAKHIMWAVAANKHTAESTLKFLSDQTEDTDTLVAIYNNPNATGKVRTRVAKMNTTVASLDRVSKAQAKYGDLNAALGRHSEAISAGGRERVVCFDPEKVKSVGFEPKDIDALVRYFQGNYLYSTHYDEASGRYTGWID